MSPPTLSDIAKCFSDQFGVHQDLATAILTHYEFQDRALYHTPWHVARVGFNFQTILKGLKHNLTSTEYFNYGLAILGHDIIQVNADDATNVQESAQLTKHLITQFLPDHADHTYSKYILDTALPVPERDYSNLLNWADIWDLATTSNELWTATSAQLAAEYISKGHSLDAILVGRRHFLHNVLVNPPTHFGQFSHLPFTSDFLSRLHSRLLSSTSPIDASHSKN